MRRFLFCLLACVTIAPPLAAQTPGKLTLGINRNWVSVNGVDGPFSDAMTAAVPWQLNGSVLPAGPPPVGAVHNAIFPPNYPGVCTLTAKGKGTLQLYFPSGYIDAGNLKSGTLSLQKIATFTGTETYTFIPVKGSTTAASITVTASDPAAPIDQIKVLLPGAGPGLYHPSFLDSIGAYPIIRFMDSQVIANSKEARWADRNTQPGYDLESFIDLCNETGADGWFCIPHLVAQANGAPTDWAREFGRLLNTRLDPARTAYLEYSDEVWNFGSAWYSETAYATAMGALAYDGAIGINQAYARLAHSCYQDIASQIDPTHGPKLKRVLARQLGNYPTAANALAEAAKRGYRFDMLAGGIYWGCSADVAAIKAAWAAGNRDQALQMMDDGFRKGYQQILPMVAQFRALADQYGMQLGGYEGGAGMPFADPSMAPIAAAYVMDPRCSRMHVDAYSALSGARVDILMYYSHAHPDPTWSSLTPGGIANGRYWGNRTQLAGTSPAISLGIDATTKGSWPGVYGSLGSLVAGAPTPPIPQQAGIAIPQPPAVIPTKPYVYAASTTDPRAPQLPDGSGNRVAGAWIDPTALDLGVSGPPSGGIYRLSLYFLDWANYAGGVSQTVQILSPDGSKVLDTRALTGLSAKPVYLSWALQGAARIKIVKTAGGGAILSGVFLDPVPAP